MIEVEEIHRQALAVLERIGVAMENEEARRLIAGRRGVRIDGVRVFLEAALVDDQVAANRSSLETAAAAAGAEERDRDIITASCCDMPQHYRNPLTGETALYTSGDLVAATRFLEAWGGGGAWSMVPGVPRDVPPQLQALTEYYVGCEWCSRGGNVDTLHPPEALPYIFDMACAIGHEIDGCGIFTVSPLRLGGFELDTAIAFRDRFASFGVASLPAAGASAPVHPQVAWAVAVAEVLAGMVVLRLAGGGKPVSVSPGMYPFDLRALAIVGGAPEHAAMQREAFLIARRYDPGAAYVHTINTQARHPGLQAGIEKAFGAGYAVALGCRDLQGAGLLGFDDIFSPEQFLADMELRDSLQRLAAARQPVPADKWLGMIEEGLDDGYASADTTLDHFGEVYHFPKLLDRSGMYGAPGRTAEEKIREEAVALLDRAPWVPPAPGIARAREIWEAAWRDLAGSPAPNLANT